MEDFQRSWISRGIVAPWVFKKTSVCRIQWFSQLTSFLWSGPKKVQAFDSQRTWLNSYPGDLHVDSSFSSSLPGNAFSLCIRGKHLHCLYSLLWVRVKFRQKFAGTASDLKKKGSFWCLETISSMTKTDFQNLPSCSIHSYFSNLKHPKVKDATDQVGMTRENTSCCDVCLKPLREKGKAKLWIVTRTWLQYVFKSWTAVG